MGDRIERLLTIDSDRAPPDIFAEDGTVSQHGVVADYAGRPAHSVIDFIYGGRVSNAFPNDVVRVADNLEVDVDGGIAKRDIFMVMNSSLGERDRSRIVLEVSSPNLDLISGDGIDSLSRSITPTSSAEVCYSGSSAAPIARSRSRFRASR